MMPSQRLRPSHVRGIKSGTLEDDLNYILKETARLEELIITLAEAYFDGPSKAAAEQTLREHLAKHYTKEIQ